MNITILFENEDVLVINKPAGLMVHASGKAPSSPEATNGRSTAGKVAAPTLVDWILKERPAIAGVGEPQNGVERPGIVHRLDQDTSGALIIAKTQVSFEFLKKQFQERETEKEYHAFVWGHFKESSGSIDEPIGRNSNDFRRWHAGRGARGEMREAMTKWHVLQQFLDQYGEHFSFIQLFPKTGRTHQLRVHMKYIQRPIVADELYASTKPHALGFNRLALHAYKITFSCMDGQRITVEAPYPSDFQSALAKYGNA